MPRPPIFDARRLWVLWLNALFLIEGAAVAPGQEAGRETKVLDLPATQPEYDTLKQNLGAAITAGDLQLASRLVEQLDVISSLDPSVHFFRALLEAKGGETEKALNSLKAAVDTGFREAARLKQDSAFDSLRGTSEFAELVGLASNRELVIPDAVQNLPARIEGGFAEVTADTLIWDFSTRAFRSSVTPKADRGVSLPLPTDETVRQLFQKWSERGTFAGNRGDLYDNYDHLHSNLNADRFPHLLRTRYSAEIREKQFAHGVQFRFLHDAVVIGNSSMASVDSFLWRSQPRLAYANPLMSEQLALQYRFNHLYVYPEHRDYDPGHNGVLPDGEGENQAGGFGDVYPAVSPYLLISQGSSGSDQAIVEALILTLAAFQPEVKSHLKSHGLLMPTLQKIFRWCYGGGTREGYLTKESHPAVFDGTRLDVVGMVKMAQDINLETIPPHLSLRVLAEEKDSLFGGDRIMDTPQAISRVFRSPKYTRTMIVSTAGSFDLNHRPLKFRWTILQGDESRIRIRPLNETGSIAEVVVAWHERFPVTPRSRLETNRVDIGVFADNGESLSAPAFVSTYFLDNESRNYDARQRLMVLDYADPEKAGNYVDPMIEPRKEWRDEFRYDFEGRLVGWKRKRDGLVQQFTANGRLVTKTDAEGKPTETRAVSYLLAPDPTGEKPPRVEMKVE